MVLNILIALFLFFVVGPLVLMFLATLVSKFPSNTKSYFESPANDTYVKAEQEKRASVAAHNEALAAKDPELRRVLFELNDPEWLLSREERFWLELEARRKGARL